MLSYLTIMFFTPNALFCWNNPFRRHTAWLTSTAGCIVSVISAATTLQIRNIFGLKSTISSVVNYRFFTTLWRLNYRLRSQKFRKKLVNLANLESYLFKNISFPFIFIRIFYTATGAKLKKKTNENYVLIEFVTNLNPLSSAT
jgi:hypothetical protein